MSAASFYRECAKEEGYSNDMHTNPVDLISYMNLTVTWIVCFGLAGVHNEGECEEERVACEDQDEIESPNISSCEFIDF